MTKQEAALIFEKELRCNDVEALVCTNDGCDGCEYFVTDKEIHNAMRVAIDILKNGEKDGQKGETSTTKDQAAEQLHSPGETVEGSHPGDGS